MSKVQCQKCSFIFESSDAGGFVEHKCASDWRQAKEHLELTEQRVREIVREEIEQYKAPPTPRETSDAIEDAIAAIAAGKGQT